jgi:nitroreductase
MARSVPDFVPLTSYRRFGEAEMVHRSRCFLETIRRRRTVREFSNQPIPDEVLTNAIQAAGTAPNGANLQPWHFVVIRDQTIKQQIREAAEVEERDFYENRAPQEWLDALAPLGTDEHKAFLETAPALIAIFGKAYELRDDGKHVKNYYVSESVGIATGFLISSLHLAGLATLTHTPSPMAFLNEILERPKNERPYLLLVVGYPAENVLVPNITKKPLDEICSFR